jgi:hypothetical protein
VPDNSVDKPHSKYPHVYAIVRFDLEESATVVKVLPSQTMAEQEVARLREVNEAKPCIYTVQLTRFVEAV